MSGVYIGIDGKARKVKGGYIGIDGVARKIKKGYIGDENGVAQLCWSTVEFDPVFANNTWEEIALACQMGAVPASWEVGNQKTMTIDGTDYAIDIIGKDHDDYADGSGKAPLTFQLHDCYNTKYKVYTNSNTSGGWGSCVMRTTHLPDILAKMPDGVQAAIKKVVKEYAPTYNNTAVSISEDMLFLLSEHEYSGSQTNSPFAEGKRYEYYNAGNSGVKKFNGTSSSWTLRSLHKQFSGSALVVQTSGTVGSVSLANGYELGLAFAFCF